jgi:para-aminobenzoate synthetase/4-amino-4-deoxychorismate lyase
MFKLKLLLTKWGEIKFSLEKISEHKKYGKIAISKTKIDSKNKFQYFKTTKRKLYNSEFTKWQKEGFDDVIFVNEDNLVVEGAISNIMIEINNEMITPPIKDGLLPGCYREYLISNKNVIEKSFGIDELLNANRVFIFNSVRKEIEIKEIYN